MSDAFAAWLPTLQDLEKRKVDDPNKYYYQRFGWEMLVVPDDCVRVAARMGDLKTLFDERYAFRMLNAETMEQWQIRLQTRFDSYVRIYERAYELYERYSDALKDDMEPGELRTWDRTYSDLSSGDSSSVNTPDSVINASGDYADARTKSSGSSSGTDSVTEKKVKTGEAMINAVNEGIMKWKDLDIAFIKEFENNFLNIFWW